MAPRKRKAAGARIVRASRARQRQHLIDACISALHQYGPSRTTVEKVVAIARMSPGIVRFYFDSKAAMLVASLQFLATEFEERVLVPVAKLKSDPVAALTLLVDLYLDPDIASPRKVSVWYSFWGEASSRQEYYDICGQKDQNFAALVHELVERLVAQGPAPPPDPDGVALGLIGALEMLWQDFAFQDERAIDRPAAKRRCLAYLRSVFPDSFGVRPNGRFIGAWAYASAKAFRLEQALFRESRHLVAHESALPRVGDFVCLDIGSERVIAVRCADAAVRVLRNRCPRLPHAVVEARGGRAEAWICREHGLRFALDGVAADAGTEGALDRLSCEQIDGWILADSRPDGARDGVSSEAWRRLGTAAILGPVGPALERPIAADWKLVVARWLESVPPTAQCPDSSPGVPEDVLEWFVDGLDAKGWTGRALRALHGAAAGSRVRRRIIAPNHWIESRADGVTVLQIVACASGSSLLREWRYTRVAEPRAARLGAYLAHRAAGLARRSSALATASAQQGIERLGYPPTDHESRPGRWFHDWLLGKIPDLSMEKRS